MSFGHSKHWIMLYYLKYIKHAFWQNTLTLSEKVAHTRHHRFKAKTFMKTPFTFLLYKFTTGTTVWPNVCKTLSMTGPQYATPMVKDCTDCTLSDLWMKELIYRDTNVRRIFMYFTFLDTHFSNMQASSPSPAPSSVNTWHQPGCSFRTGIRWDHRVIKGWKYL